MLSFCLLTIYISFEYTQFGDRSVSVTVLELLPVQAKSVLGVRIWVSRSYSMITC